MGSLPLKLLDQARRPGLRAQSLQENSLTSRSPMSLSGSRIPLGLSLGAMPSLRAMTRSGCLPAGRSVLKDLKSRAT